MLEVEQLSVVRGGRRVVDGVSFRAREGEVLVVLGPNGAGKSSLLEAIVGLVPCVTGVASGARGADGASGAGGRGDRGVVAGRGGGDSAVSVSRRFTIGRQCSRS